MLNLRTFKVTTIIFDNVQIIIIGVESMLKSRKLTVGIDFQSWAGGRRGKYGKANDSQEILERKVSAKNIKYFWHDFDGNSTSSSWEQPLHLQFLAQINLRATRVQS